MPKFKHLTHNDRRFIRKMIDKKVPISIIADTLGVHRSTVYREIKKNLQYFPLPYDKVYKYYSAIEAQKNYDKQALKRRRTLKLNKHELNAVESLLIAGFSPEMAIKTLNIDVSISTIYNYIDRGIFPRYSNKDLPHGKQPRRKKPDRRYKKDFARQNSITFRPAIINSRESFGHWEMDTVIGKNTGKNNCLLVLTERKTRYEIIIKIKDKTSKSVISGLRSLQRKYGYMYSNIFQTITCDNGSEFADVKGMKLFSSTKFYYCHPYSSWERVSNENRNKLIRRFIPKHTNINNYSNQFIKNVENFINFYPMRILNYKKPVDLFQIELNNLYKMTKCRISC